MCGESGLAPSADVEIKPTVTVIESVASPRPALVFTSLVYTGNEFLCQLATQSGDWLKLGISHVISSVDLWSEPRNVLIHLRGSFYFNPIGSGIA